MAAEKNTQFNYLLNSMERAAQSKSPAQEGYGSKRKALMAHVRELERKAAAYDAAEAPPTQFTRRIAELLVKVPLPPKAITYEAGVELLNELQGIARDMEATHKAGVIPSEGTSNGE